MKSTGASPPLQYQKFGGGKHTPLTVAEPVVVMFFTSEPSPPYRSAPQFVETNAVRLPPVWMDSAGLKVCRCHSR